DALRLYNLAAERAPGDFQLEMDRFYALVELERHAQAMALTDDLVESQAIWLQVPGSRVIKPNPRRLKAEIARALSRAYADQLAAAESLFSEMLAEAPHNTDVRQELGNVYRWRGWPRRSAFEYRQVLSVEPDLLSARIGYANAMLDLHQHSEFRPAMAALTADYPDDPGVQRIARRYELYNRNELQLSASGGESSGEQFGSRNYEADLVAYLRPVRHRWRPFVSLHTASAEFSDGDGDRRRAGLGLEYRRPDHRIALGASASLEGASRPGLALSYTWDLSDFWQFDGLLETETNAMPLRGYRVGVDASRLRAGARYRFSDQSHLALAGDYLDFSDGNRRTAWLLSGGRRILNRPDWKVDISTSLYTSRNELTAVSYFSPSSDRAVSVSLDGQWRIFRRYERSFSHRLSLTAGHYNQSGFAGGYVGSIEYQQMLQISNALEFYYGVRRNRALYDGDFEYGTYFTGGLRGRF
ncbi:MAG: poly-beta-1,6 N-acetyl-D-glucosamine export porin PgaA, partial [Gammaproteobacteria bacterium]|nr:poly-beta-1,6 N-acetyl-D-glucosamine export porin PgaA [Gammaproteobacteria bacterium]